MILFMVSCGQETEVTDPSLINGYWTIEKVVFPDGSEREYTLSPTIDYFELRDTMGFRKKVQPQLDGTYITSDDAINFDLQVSEGQYHMIYRNETESWREKLSALDSLKMILVSDGKITYHYTRFQPLLDY